MKKSTVFAVITALLCVCVFTACDPVYPPGNIRIKQITALTVGQSVSIEIIYPYTGGSTVNGWQEQKIEILSGAQAISVSGLTVTALKAGTAEIEVSAKTVLFNESYKNGIQDKVYTCKARVTVK